MFLKRFSLRIQQIIPICVLLVGILTGAIFHFQHENIRTSHEDSFSFLIQNHRQTIEQYFLFYEEVLLGGVGLFGASENVTQEKWEKYVNNIRLTERYPGMNGLGFIEQIDRKNLSRFINVTQANEIPDFE